MDISSGVVVYETLDGKLYGHPTLDAHYTNKNHAKSMQKRIKKMLKKCFRYAKFYNFNMTVTWDSVNNAYLVGYTFNGVIANHRWGTAICPIEYF